MKYILLLITTFLLFIGCSTKPKIIKPNMPKTYLKVSSFEKLPNFTKENFKDALKAFKKNCQTKKAKKIYPYLCKKVKKVKNAKKFFMHNFTPYTIYTKEYKDSGLLTGYYEAELKGSLTKSKKYKYPIYTTPTDLIEVDLSSIYPKLKYIRLRGRLNGNKIVPYYERKDCKGKNCNIICYVDSKIDLFFLEVQGSGRVKLNNGKTLYIGYANQNGHKYRSIGKYMIKKGYIKKENISLQTIKKYLQTHKDKIDEILNYNKSVVFFRVKKRASTGSLGLTLTPKRSIAVDRDFIPLGSMLYMNTVVDNKHFSKIVFAQDSGGAIKGALRADLFLGYGSEAMRVAGNLKSNLELWVLLPKESR